MKRTKQKETNQILRQDLRKTQTGFPKLLHKVAVTSQVYSSCLIGQAQYTQLLNDQSFNLQKRFPGRSSHGISSGFPRMLFLHKQ